jgi:hypothetical protein
VLEHQLATAEPLSSDERSVTATFDADALLDRSTPRELWQPVLDLLDRQACAIRAT